MHEHVDVEILRFALEPLHAFDELLDVHDPVAVPVEQDEEQLRLRGVHGHGVHVLLDVLVLQTFVELLNAYGGVPVGVHLLEYFPQVGGGRLARLGLLLDDHGPVVLGKLDGAVDEDARHDVQHGEDAEEDEDQGDDEVGRAHPLQRCCDVAPADAPGHGLEERVHCVEERAVALLYEAVLMFVQVLRSAHCQDDCKHIYQHREQGKQPEERQHRVCNHVCHDAQLRQKAHHPHEPQYAEHPQDLQEPSCRPDALEV
mmetsp:Transcript_4408/g.14125  ORF Transcript_4408/g.14125 Transcript_4408/m.14125 type:complete len:257 (+) Transcript_4408:173-943(+)